MVEAELKRLVPWVVGTPADCSPAEMVGTPADCSPAEIVGTPAAEIVGGPAPLVERLETVEAEILA